MDQSLGQLHFTIIMNEQTTNCGASRLIEWLHSIEGSRGTMAGLRYLLTPSLRHRGWSALSGIGGIGEYPHEIIAGLYALHPSDTEELRNFGASCRLLSQRRRTGNDKDKEKNYSPLDTRFRRLLDADRSELADILPNLFRNLRSEQIPVNYFQLFNDLCCWNEYTRRRWAQEYWNPQPQKDAHASVLE